PPVSISNNESDAGKVSAAFAGLSTRKKSIGIVIVAGIVFFVVVGGAAIGWSLSSGQKKDKSVLSSEGDGNEKEVPAVSQSDSDTPRANRQATKQDIEQYNEQCKSASLSSSLFSSPLSVDDFADYSFVGDTPIPEDVDMASNRYHLIFSYLQDKNRVYYYCQAIDGADPASFVVLSEGYATDKNNVYYSGQAIDGADPASFVVLSEGYATDKNNVYYLASAITGADLASFVVLSEGYATD
ncbi:MAG: hypothetical protein COW61_04415, partial [Candidatus Yonathbacteria bacterium CG17_big_fil_post_rev_8_21_14_2_50_46_19]